MRLLLPGSSCPSGEVAHKVSRPVDNGDEVDSRHHAMRRPVRPPVMDGEILNCRALAGGGVLVLDRIAAGYLRLSRVRIR